MSWYDDVYLGVPEPSKNEVIVEKRVEEVLETTRKLLETGDHELSEFFDWEAFEEHITEKITKEAREEKDDAEIDRWERNHDF